MQKNANETAKETKNMFLQSAKELKAVTTLAACAKIGRASCRERVSSPV